MLSQRNGFRVTAPYNVQKKLANSAVHYLRRYFSEDMPSFLDTVRKKIVQFLEPEHLIKSFNTGTEQCWGSVTFWYGTDPDPYL